MPRELDDVFEKAGMVENNVGFGQRPALIVVDMQRAMTDPDHPLGSELGDTVEGVNRVIAAAREGGVPVVMTRVVAKEGRPQIGIWKKVEALKKLTPESKWVGFDDRISITDDDYVLEKFQSSAFHETELESLLTEWNVDTVVLVGASTSGCIRATALDACANGYRTIVPAAAVGDRSESQHEANLIDIDTRIGDVVDLESVDTYFADQSSRT